MTDQPTLSGEEIAALMSELKDGGTRRSGSGGSPRPYSFGSDAARPMSALPALDRLNERMAKRMRDLIEPFARAKPAVTSEPAVIRPFEDWKAEQSEFTSLTVYSFKPLKGAMLISIEPAFISRLVDAFYGGSGANAQGRAREFTATEERLLHRLTDALIAALVEVWTEVVPARAQLRSRETAVGFANIARSDEPVAICRFTVKPLAGTPAAIEIVYPVAGLRSVEPELAAKGHEDPTARGGDWRERLASAVGEVRVQARTVIARPELSLAELMQLSVGDVIPVSLPSLVPLLVEGKPVALGTVGERDGRAALKIEKMEKGRMAA